MYTVAGDVQGPLERQVQTLDPTNCMYKALRRRLKGYTSRSHHILSPGGILDIWARIRLGSPRGKKRDN